MKKALYVGSFDPPTNGHQWMIEQGSKLFDALVVGVAVNADKQFYLSIANRVVMLEKMVAALPNVTVDMLGKQFTAVHARTIGAQYLLRGVRSLEDEAYELVIARVNQDIEASLTTVILPAPLELREISSSLVRKLVGPDHWDKVVSKYVPPVVLDQLQERFHG